MDRCQARRNVGPDLRSILFETQDHILLKSGCISWDDFNSENIEIMSSLQSVPELLEGTVYLYSIATGLGSAVVSRAYIQPLFTQVFHYNTTWEYVCLC